MLSSINVAKKYMRVYYFHVHGKYFTRWDLRGMLETGQTKTRAAHFRNFLWGLLCTGNLAFRLQYLFAMIDKILKVLSQLWRYLSGLGVGVVVTELCKLKVRAWVKIHNTFFSAVIFISVLLQGLMGFSDIVILCSRPNSCCQQNPKCSDMPLLFLGLFSSKSSNDC